MKAYTEDRKEIKVGDWVGFKSDVEQSGKVKKIMKGHNYGGPVLVLVNEHGFEGGYIGGKTETIEHASDCWVE